MENIIKKAIEGGYDKKYIPVIGIDFPRHHTTVTTILMDRDFWQALGKACGWGCNCDNGHVFVGYGGEDNTDPIWDGCQNCVSGGVYTHQNDWKENALRFHEINLTQSWDEAVKWLESITNN